MLKDVRERLAAKEAEIERIAQKQRDDAQTHAHSVLLLKEEAAQHAERAGKVRSANWRRGARGALASTLTLVC